MPPELQMVFVFVLLAATFAAMVWEKVSADIISMLAMGVLLATQILTPQEAFQVFSSDAVITVGGMFVLSAALERTGAIGHIGHHLNRLVGQSDWSVLVVMLPFVALISAFINNTPVVLVFMPIMISLASKRDIKPSKLLIPLSFASILGGCCTLVGTSTNIIISSTAQGLGERPFSMFELSKIGIILAVAGIIYLLTFGRNLLPDRQTLASLLQSTESKQYLTEVVVVSGSPLIGKKLTETPLKSIPNARVLEITRNGDPLATPLDEETLQQGDHLRLSTILSSVVEIKNLQGLEILKEQEDMGLELVGTQKAIVVECIIAPSSSLEGQSIRQQDLRRRYGVLVLAVHRQGVNIRRHFADVELHYGDTLLIEGTESGVRRLQESRDVLVLSGVPYAAPRRRKRWLASGTFAAVIGLAALGAPISAVALLGALFVIVTGCIESDEAYEAIDWKIIFLIVGMLALGSALVKTGGVMFIANLIQTTTGGGGELMILSAVILIASLLTTFLSNNGVAVMLTPIVIQIAANLGVDSRPFLVAVAIGCSACFATPIGYQTNTLVYGAGGYMFRDFIKVGIPLNLIIWILGTLFIPLLYPLKPSPTSNDTDNLKPVASSEHAFPKLGRSDRFPVVLDHNAPGQQVLSEKKRFNGTWNDHLDWLSVGNNLTHSLAGVRNRRYKSLNPNLESRISKSETNLNDPISNARYLAKDFELRVSSSCPQPRLTNIGGAKVLLSLYRIS